MLHLTNPCAKRKVLILTKPKGKIYKTKSLRNYITLYIIFAIRTLSSPVQIYIKNWRCVLQIVVGVLQGDTFAPYLFIICLDYVLRPSIGKIKENSFELTKKRIRRYPTKTITDADYADDIATLANAPAQAETPLHSLERATVHIGLHVNAHKTEYMCFNQTGDIPTLNSSSLKLVNNFTYLGSSISSTEADIEIRLTKVWIAINRLSVIWKSDLTDKKKTQFLPSSYRVDTAIWMHYMDAN